jgi:hypothetical protein
VLRLKGLRVCLMQQHHWPGVVHQFRLRSWQWKGKVADACRRIIPKRNIASQGGIASGSVITGTVVIPNDIVA